MSMTQEEIEALMNDASSSFSQPEENEPEESIDDILSGIDGVIEDEPASEDDSSIDDILAGIDGIVDDEPAVEDDSSIDDILAGIDGIVDDEPESSTDESMDDILAGIDGVVDEPQVESTPSSSGQDESVSKKIDEGVYPLPVSNEHQVVNQLNEVAEDSEEKASQIFDVLSYILDENDVIQKNVTEFNSFVDNQLQLLETLNKKFPNIEVFSENINQAQNIKSVIGNLTTTVDGENNKVFEAMELMQYHDINRQKIERVMAVIRKLANYLNGIFSDDSDKPEVQIAKHISGDGQDTVTEDDLDSLISEFNK